MDPTRICLEKRPSPHITDVWLWRESRRKHELDALVPAVYLDSFLGVVQGGSGGRSDGFQRFIDLRFERDFLIDNAGTKRLELHRAL
jgi:hypothetical protein